MEKFQIYKEYINRIFDCPCILQHENFGYIFLA